MVFDEYSAYHKKQNSEAAFGKKVCFKVSCLPRAVLRLTGHDEFQAFDHLLELELIRDSERSSDAHASYSDRQFRSVRELFVNESHSKADVLIFLQAYLAIPPDTIKDILLKDFQLPTLVKHWLQKS